MPSSPQYTVLYVDDEPNNLLAFRQAFFRSYQILTASSAEEALALMAQHSVQLVISDQQMPRITGLQLLQVIKHTYPETIRMIVTGYSDLEVVIAAFNEVGIFHYALKPWDNQALQMAINNALDKYELTAQNQQLIQTLSEVNISLEQKVIERTQELVASNQLKDKLFSIVSHDLRNPLLTLSAFMELYLTQPDAFTPQENRQLLADMQASVGGITEMLNNLLQWSQNQLHQREPVLTSHSIQATLDDLLVAYHLSAHQKCLLLETRWPEEELFLLTDSDLLRGIFRNLISNAIKFTPAGGRIVIEAIRHHQQVLLSVTDTGVGISEANLGKLLSRRELMSTRGTANEKGTGLGLTLCQDYLEKLGSVLQIESLPGQGTSFRFYLPVSIQRQPA
jgi:two-component system sensor histidine kinase/response regulator